jgi:hypothetical protein
MKTWKNRMATFNIKSIVYAPMVIKCLGTVHTLSFETAVSHARSWNWPPLGSSRQAMMPETGKQSLWHVRRKACNLMATSIEAVDGARRVLKLPSLRDIVYIIDSRTAGPLYLRTVSWHFIACYIIVFNGFGNVSFSLIKLIRLIWIIYFGSTHVLDVFYTLGWTFPKFYSLRPLLKRFINIAPPFKMFHKRRVPI